MKVVYSKKESLEEYIARMDAQDARYKEFVIRQRLIKQLVKFLFIVAVIAFFAIMAIR